MKQSNAIAYLRQLCCSGLNKEIVIPEFLRAVQSLIPSGNNTFTGVDEQFLPTYHLLGFESVVLDENTPFIIANYITPQRSNLAFSCFKQQSIIEGWEVLDNSFFMSDFYNLVFRPLDQHFSICSPVFSNGKPIGMLSLFRSRQQKPFENREKKLLASLSPYVTHALKSTDETDIRYSDNGVSGMMVLDTQGKIIYQSQEAKKLLVLSCRPTVSINAEQQERELLGKLTQLCHNLDSIYRGENAAPPSWSYTNSTGRFNFRAYWLDRKSGESGGLIGMTVEHLEPIVLRLLRGMQNSPLSPMQKEVALLLAQGIASNKIGERLNIKLNTVKDHTDKIFTKLDIHHREELLPLLLSFDSVDSCTKV